MTEQRTAMSSARFQVLAIGNAIVDVLALVDDGFLATRELKKGAMSLVDADAARQLYNGITPERECSGGSAANTIAALASLGNSCAFIGKVRDDALGDVFRRDVRSLGITFDTPPATAGPPTAQCLVLITPDGQRTMQTFLGASVELGPADIKMEQVKASAVLYMEGYLWDSPGAREAYIKASDVAHQTGCHVALSLSDPFCVDRHRESFRDLVEHHIDILFANELEIMSLYEVKTLRRRTASRAPAGASCSPDPQREGLSDRQRRRGAHRGTPNPPSKSWTPPAPATPTPPVSCMA